MGATQELLRIEDPSDHLLLGDVPGDRLLLGRVYDVQRGIEVRVLWWREGEPLPRGS